MSVFFIHYDDFLQAFSFIEVFNNLKKKEINVNSSEHKTVVFDRTLHFELFDCKEIRQPFTEHFHDYYVIGTISKGCRILFCNQEEFHVNAKDIVLFNPGDIHSCHQCDDGGLDYCGINLTKEVMRRLAFEIYSVDRQITFSKSVVRDSSVYFTIQTLKRLVINNLTYEDKEECLLLMLTLIFDKYVSNNLSVNYCNDECISIVCNFLEKHYMEDIHLIDLCKLINVSKSTLLRCFVKAKKMTPYCYLQNIRIGKAKEMLEKGALPIDVALNSGFTDQSHFTHYFKRFLGVTPRIYRDIFIKK